LFEKAESKNKLLRSVAGGGVEQVGPLQARWDKFELMMESHELMVKEQVYRYCISFVRLISTTTTTHYLYHSGCWLYVDDDGVVMVVLVVAVVIVVMVMLLLWRYCCCCLVVMVVVVVWW
jgi:hypothetical protein